jgi:hypothetical protein
MAGGTGLYRFEKRYAETFAAGLATEGLVPFCTIYSTFLQRGYDQVVHDVALQKLPGGWARPIREQRRAVLGCGSANMLWCSPHCGHQQSLAGAQVCSGCAPFQCAHKDAHWRKEGTGSWSLCF